MILRGGGYVWIWLPAAASALAGNVRCQVDEREDSESAERQQWVGFCRSEGLAAAYDDAAVHEAGIGHEETFSLDGNRVLNVRLSPHCCRSLATLTFPR